jgi:nucleoid DNA-binding protein
MEAKRYGKKDFIKDIFENDNVSEFKKSEILNFLHSFIFYFQQALKNGYVVELRGIGIFSIKKIPARKQKWNVNKGRRLINNKHQDLIIFFPATNSVRFKPSINLRKLINELKSETVLRKEVKFRKKKSTSLDEKFPNNLTIINNVSLVEIKEAVKSIVKNKETIDDLISEKCQKLNNEKT